MKKNLFLLFSMLAFLACEQNELDYIIDNQSREALVSTRSTNSIADFDPISELANIPVNIKNIGNVNNKYLSCVSKGTKVDLYNKDDGSLRQRWYVKLGNIFLVGGNSSISSQFDAIVIPNTQNNSYPLLMATTQPYLIQYSFVPSSDKCYYNIKTISTIGIPAPPVKYLQSNSLTGSDLSYKETNPGNLALWEFCPVGEYEIINLEYIYTSVDNLTPKEVICARDEYKNTSSSSVTWDYSVTTKYSETSNFSRTEGISASVSKGLTLGLPNLLGQDTSLQLNASIQQQTSKSWTYGTSNTKEFTETRTGHIPVPPNTIMKLDATLVMYEGSVTYVATLRKIGESKTFRVKGKWSGTCFSMFKAKTYNVSTNTFLGEYSLE